jgi:hypothetical protein
VEVDEVAEERIAVGRRDGAANPRERALAHEK